MKKIFLLTTLFYFLLTFQSKAQNDFKSAFGVRVGNPKSIVYKQHIKKRDYWQATLGARADAGDYFITGLRGSYIRHFDIGHQHHQLEYYYGAGIGLEFWKFENPEYMKYHRITGGLSGLLGLSFDLNKIPLILTLEWAPTYRVRGMGAGFDGSYLTLGAMFAIRK